MRSPRPTLRRRLVAVVIGLLAVAAATMGAVSTLALRGTLVTQLDIRLQASADRAAKAPDGRTPLPGEGGLPAGDPPAGLTVRGQGAGTLNLTVFSSGLVRAGYLDRSGAFLPLDAAQRDVLAAVPADGMPRTVTLPGLGSWRVVAVAPHPGGLLVTGLSMAEISSTVRSYLIGEAAIAGLGLAVAGLAGTVLVRREMEPLERVAATAARVSEQPLERGAVVLERVPEGDTDATTEVGQVGAALNRMLGHVESALAARHESEMQVRQFVADASHELRTPLASIRGYAELVRRLPEPVPPDAVHAMERVESESVRMTALVEDLLLLARLDAGRALDRTEVDLAALAVDAVTDAHAAGPRHTWRLELPGADVPPATGDLDAPDTEIEPAVALGDEHRLRQVLANLLANARVHTPEGTTVVTSVWCRDGEVLVQVRDDGPGIAPDLVPRLFQRFARGDAARSPKDGSTGLGLAIVHAVVTAHGGRIEVDGTPGATTFTVHLPAAT
ncbi:ATP-binding protein [Isoptericola sp. b441]|uniref:histidine kinase n=1 Tax=Actinotalea lenta TaxID=3064654 RepID=A0ABT9DBG5_9CELL|nr:MULTISPECIES: ATP-binding protein [unclassified Isoptericola]MDO8106543.1 ATP-binding protein [Isoptericola sp. b441]MDO8121749.1 ATP-binding protein [Isoptericola sp. b490]